MKTTDNQTVGATVALDYRTASVFQKFGIDFCCKGGLSIDEACNRKGIDKQKLLNEIALVNSGQYSAADDFNQWDLDKLADHIEAKHHSYVSTQLPVLIQFLNKLCKVHGERHPELFDIYEEFGYVAQELTAHMKKEELILFPFIKKMIHTKNNHNQLFRPGFGSVQNPIHMMMDEHNVEGERLNRIAILTKDYNPPVDACTTYRVTFKMLKDFEADLHKHIHLENNILFPKAILLEKELAV